MKNPSGAILTATLTTVCLMSLFGAQPDQGFDGIWVGTEKLTLDKRTDCPKPEHETLPARIAIAQGGTLVAVVNGYGPGRYAKPQGSSGTLVFEIANRRRGELRLSADGKTLVEKGYVRRTISIGGYFNGPGGASVGGGARQGALSGQAPPQMTGMTACLDQVTGAFHREK